MEQFKHSLVSGYWSKIVGCILSNNKELNEKAYDYLVEAITKYNKGDLDGKDK